MNKNQTSSQTASTCIIAGTGLQQLPGFRAGKSESVDTPFGAPSAPLVFGQLAEKSVVFLQRHGTGPTIPPHRINYRANIHALKKIGIKTIIAIAAVGGIARKLNAGDVVIPHQLIDYTWGRAQSFFNDGSEGVPHIDFSNPYDAAVREKIIATAQRAKVDIVDGAVYAVTQGPRLETAAEIDRLERDGADIVGMTAMPEAALARELGLAYAAIAVVVNPAAGRGAHAEIDMDGIARHMENGGARALTIIAGL